MIHDTSAFKQTEFLWACSSFSELLLHFAVCSDDFELAMARVLDLKGSDPTRP